MARLTQPATRRTGPRRQGAPAPRPANRRYIRDPRPGPNKVRYVPESDLKRSYESQIKLFMNE
jgi:hypothetical protein